MSDPSPSREESPTSVEELHAGAVIASSYTLTQRIGEGGMGVVWGAEALDPASGAPRVALKFLKDAAASPAARRRFLGEARVAAAIRHPHVRAVHDVLELRNGAPVLVMQRLDGESLSAVLKRETRLSIGETAAIMTGVVSAVGAAHALGVVHRDLKPENVFLATRGADERVQVLDFGIAKWTLTDGESDSMQTASGALVGTPCFMAPEQVFGERRIDHRADVWALGLMLYQCLTGILPTRADNVGQVMKIIVGRTITPVEERRADVPEGLARLVARMLVRDRKKRLADLREVAAELALHTDARAPAFGAPLAAPIADDDGDDDAMTSGAATLDSTELEAPPRSATAAPVSHDPEPAAPRRRWVRWAALAAMLGAAAITAVAISSNRDASRPSTSDVAASPVGATSQGRPEPAPDASVSSASARETAPAPSTPAEQASAPSSGHAATTSPPATSVDRARVAPVRSGASATPRASAAPTASAFAPSETFK